MARKVNRKKRDEGEYHKLITSYHEMLRENKTLRKEVEYLRERNKVLKRRLSYYVNSTTIVKDD